MNNISQTDKIVLSYYNIPYIIEAYKIFYGNYPIFSDETEQIEKEKMEYMMTILTEYNIYNCDKKSELNYIYLNSPKFKIDLLYSKVKNIDNQEYEFEQLCKENPINELEKQGIKSISYIIKNQLEKEKIEDSVYYLKMLHNILIYRSYAITLVSSSSSFSNKVYKMAEKIATRYKEFNYTSENIFEIIKFISFKLKLLPESSNKNIDIGLVISEAEQQGINNELYLGLLSNDKDKIFTK